MHVYASVNWWRRRESNPRPQVICFRLYMLIRPISLVESYPVGRENNQRSWISFNGSTPGVLSRDSVLGDSRAPTHTDMLRAEGTKRGY